MSYEVKVYSMGWGKLKNPRMEVCSVVISVNNSIPDQQQLYLIEKDATGKFKAGMPLRERFAINISKMDPTTAKDIEPGELEKLFADSTQLGQPVSINAEYFFNNFGKHEYAPSSSNTKSRTDTPQDIYSGTPKKGSNGQDKKGKGRSKIRNQKNAV